MSDDILRDLVEGERTGLVPPEGAQQATWGRVAASVAIAAPVVPAATIEPLAASKAAAASGAKWWVNGFFALAIGGATVAGVVAIKRDRQADVVAPPTVVAYDDVPAEPRAAAQPASSAEAEAEIAEAETLDDARAAPVVETPSDPVDATDGRSVRPRTAKTDVRNDADAPAPSSALAEEARLLFEARRQLRGGHPRAALAPLSEHARRFADGQLSEERIALTARALCEAGDVERGREQAAALRAAFPSSSHLGRVDRACG